MDEKQQEGGLFPAPPPPHEQVAGHSKEREPAFFASSFSDSDEAGQGMLDRLEACDSQEKGRTSSDAVRSGFSQGLAPKRLAAIIAGVACFLAVVAVVSAAAMAWMGGSSAASDERAIDSRPANAERGTSNAEEQSSEASQVQEELSSQLAALAADEDGKLSAYVERFMADYDAGVDPALSYGFSDLGISAEELMEKLCDGLAFNIESVDVYGSKAWVEVTVVSKGFSEQGDVFASRMADSAGGFDDAEQYKIFMKDALLAAFDEVKARSNTALVVVDRDEDGWSLSFEDTASLLGDAWYG
ncbi:MAG: hypothetical protein Q4D92_02135 [Slackia sp.]|nr:hypothetical protein [Slackia sp.]